MPAEEDYILDEFRKTLRRNAGDVADLDNGIRYKFNFTVLRFEHILQYINTSIPPNRWSYYRIGFTTKGTGEFITGIYNFKARRNTLIVMPARVITSSKNWTPDTEGYFAIFNREFLIENNFPYKYLENKKILKGTYQPYVHLTDEQAENVCDIFETILREKGSDNIIKNELIALKVAELLILSEQYFTEQLQLEHNLPSLDIIKRFSELVESNFTEQRSVKFYAGQLSIHPNYLNSLIKKHSGLTAKESIQNRLLLEIKYLLHSTDLSIKEISNKMGFNDPNYFTSFFTQLESISPGNYRSSFV